MAAAQATMPSMTAARSGDPSLTARVEALEAEVADLRAELDALKARLT
jgi:uncharacterized protein YceH (UPF0502 family)